MSRLAGSRWLKKKIQRVLQLRRTNDFIPFSSSLPSSFRFDCVGNSEFHRLSARSCTPHVLFGRPSFMNDLKYYTVSRRAEYMYSSVRTYIHIKI